jgi:hypothetical protein
VLLVHGYYIMGIENIDNLIADLNPPWCAQAEVPSEPTLELNDYSRSLRLEGIVGGMEPMYFETKNVHA